jgi:hypothetical protein
MKSVLRKLFFLAIALNTFEIFAVAPTLAQQSPYSFKHVFHANEETIRLAQDATDQRRAIEANKFFFPTVATEPVIQKFEPNGAITNEVVIIIPQNPEQQFSLANQDTPYFMATLDLEASKPMGVELSAGPYSELINNHNMTWVAGLGTIGPGKSNGETDLILSPGFNDKVPMDMMLSSLKGKKLCWQYV